MGIVDLVFPKACVGCNKEGRYICDECWEGIEQAPWICPECSRPSLEGWRHGRCRGKIDRLIAAYSYKGALQKAMKKVKYKSAWEVVEEIGPRWIQVVASELMDTDAQEIVITSVPMYYPKRKKRGFNQAEKLARILANQVGVEYREMLVRKRETRPMYGLSKDERRENVEGAFEININNQITNNKQIQNFNDEIPKLVLVVDDVWTTGSTMRECARVLRSSGYDEVWGVVVAR